MDNNIMYFLYSTEQYKEKNNILNKAGKVYTPGTVVVNGQKKSYTQLSSKKVIERFIDAKVVAEGNPKSMIYTEPKVTRKRGN